MHFEWILLVLTIGQEYFNIQTLRETWRAELLQSHIEYICKDSTVSESVKYVPYLYRDKVIINYGGLSLRNTVRL